MSTSVATPTDVIVAMRNFGNTFESNLAQAWLHAGCEDSRRLADAFPHLLEKYAATLAKSKEAT